jgi:hypothetical protein
MVKIEGVRVSRGGRIYWGALLSVLVGAPAYAYLTGVLGTMQTWSRGIGDAVAGLRETVVALIEVLFGGIAGSFRAAQDSFIAAVAPQPTVSLSVPAGVVRAFPGAAPSTSSMELNLGVFTFAVAVVVASASLFAFVRAFETAWGGLRG